MQPLWKTVWRFLKRLKMGLPFGPVIPSTSGHISEETQNTNSKEYMYCCVHCSITFNGQDMKANQGHKNEVVYTYNGHKKE